MIQQAQILSCKNTVCILKFGPLTSIENLVNLDLDLVPLSPLDSLDGLTFRNQLMYIVLVMPTLSQIYPH